MKVSACVITKNEAKNIERCLLSYKSIVDEIILVDTGSTDNTVALAEALGAKSYFFQWCDDFSAAKNYALEKATGDWILFLDADEYFEEGGASILLKELKRIHSNPAVSIIHLRMNHIDEDTGRLLSYQTSSRIFRSTLRYSRPIHEQLYLNGSTSYKGTFLPSVLLCHTGYSPSILNSKHVRNIELLMKIPDEERNCLDFYYISSDQISVRNFRGAYENAVKSIEAHDYKTLLPTHGLLYKAYACKMYAMTQLNEFSAQDLLLEARRALELIPRHPEYKYYEGYAYYRAYRWDEALASFLEAIQYDLHWQSVQYGNEFSLHKADTLTNISSIFHTMNNITKALDYSVLALKEKPYNKIAFDTLFSVIKDEKPIEIIQFINSLYPELSVKDIHFLLPRLQARKAQVPYFYYLSKLPEEEVDVSYYLTLLLFKEDYPQCVSTAMQAYKDTGDPLYERLSAVILMLSDNRELLHSCTNKLEGFYAELLSFYHENKAFRLFTKDEVDELKAFFHLLVTYSLRSTYAIDKCLQLLEAQTTLFSLDFLTAFSACDMNNQKIKLYQADSGSFNTVLMLCEAANVLFKSKQYDTCIYLLKRALLLNPAHYLTLQMLKWLLKEPSCDSVSRQNAEVLLNKYDTPFLT